MDLKLGGSGPSTASPDRAIWRAILANDSGLALFGDPMWKAVMGARQAEIDAPPGFEDVVAGLRPLTSDRFSDDVPAHWSVAFTVDDADAMAGRAAELGGTVMAPPFDAGPTRVAVLRDPQGAAFAVSKFDPESI